MKVSLEWLQTYFKESLPKVGDLAKLISLRSFEVEGLEGEGVDAVIDIGVLPNRAHDCLGYNGIATEISAITGLKSIKPEFEVPESKFKSSIECSIVNSKCFRFTAVEIRGISPQKSPDLWAKRLTIHDSRSINSIVDATNIAMLEVNQPTHAFDADKIEGRVVVRGAESGERVTTLDGKEIELEEGALIIADDVGPLDLAGVKGGLRAGISDSTKRILLTSCNFDGPTIRKSSMKHGVRTDASKRFESEIAPELAIEGLKSAVSYLKSISGDDFSISEFIDIWPRQAKPFVTGLSVRECSALLGYEVTESEISEKLKSIGCDVESGVDPQKRIVEVAIEMAEAKKPYKRGASTRFDSPDCFDCSSLVSYACSRAGLSSPRISVDQFAWCWERIEDKEIQAGDLVFSQIDGADAPNPPHYKTVEFCGGTTLESLGVQKGMGIDHVGIYIGDGEVVHATLRGGGYVKREKLNESEQFKNIVGFGRVSPLKESRVVAVIPAERLDLRRPEDLIEEVGRLLGYERVPEVETPDWNLDKEDSAEFKLGQFLKTTLSSAGFSEVMTSSFAISGDLRVLRPQNEEKPYLRTTEGLRQAHLEVVSRNFFWVRDWENQDTVKIFEIGRVFSSGGEEKIVLVISLGGKKTELEKMGENLIGAMSKLKLTEEDENKNREIYQTTIDGRGLCEKKVLVFNIPNEFRGVSPRLNSIGDIRFNKISQYPYAVRDVAVWVPDEGGEREKVASVIKSVSGALLAKLYCFDEFTKIKEGEPVKTSYAFRLILQSFDHTLLDSEIAGVTDSVYSALKDKGWEIR